MDYCVSDGNGTCSRCGIAYPDSRYARECQPLSYWIEQSRTQETQGVAVDASEAVGHGPGTELKKLLARVGITSTPDCSCNARAAEMDRNGIEWCAANESLIVGWLREQANARGLPFIDAAGRLLVRRAISNARKASA